MTLLSPAHARQQEKRQCCVARVAPSLVTDALGIRQISEVSGIAVLIVEQKMREVLKIAQRVYVLRSGRLSFSGPASALSDDQKLREVYL